MKEQKRISKRMKELRGRLRQKEKHGNFYYRLTLPGGLRKEFALKTTDEKEAIQKAANLDAVYEAPQPRCRFCPDQCNQRFFAQSIDVVFF